MRKPFNARQLIAAAIVAGGILAVALAYSLTIDGTAAKTAEICDSVDNDCDGAMEPGTPSAAAVAADLSASQQKIIEVIFTDEDDIEAAGTIPSAAAPSAPPMEAPRKRGD